MRRYLPQYKQNLLILLALLSCAAGPPLPTSLSPQDHAELRVVAAEARAAEAVMAALQAQLCARSPECRQAQEQQVAAATRRDETFARLRKSYRIGDGDQVSPEGVILRKH